MRYYKIFVDNTSGLFTYSDENLEYEIGNRVKVSFRNKERSGIIICEDSIENINFKVLPIIEKLENEIQLSKEYIKLLIWMKNYYLTSFEQLFTAVLPADLKVKYNMLYSFCEIENIFSEKIYNKYSKKIIDFVRNKLSITRNTLNKHFSSAVIKEMLKNEILLSIDDKNAALNYWYDLSYVKNENFLNVIKYLKTREDFSKSSLESNFSKEEIEKLLKDKIFILNKVIKNKNEEKESQNFSNTLTEKNINLTSEQLNAKNSIINGKNRFYLLKGVTGSGKTEVYLELIKEAFKNGKGSIFLVPEISLTPQMVERFKSEFKESIAILHSKLSNKERADEWFAIYSGAKKIVLGVRSAILAPVQNLEYIILDEEHENTYKQDNNPRYNAKYVAIKRAEVENAKLILGSATPSIESYYYAKKNIFTLIEMNSRYNNVQLPKIEIVDMKKENDLFFSQKLLDEIKANLLKGEQVMLLLNRKGYSTYIQCKDCGHVEECSHCSIKSSFYASQNVLKCNYCGRIRKYTGHCSKCGSTNLIHSGKGVERIEEEIKKYFPSANVIRVDSESSKDKEFYKNMYFDFLNKKYDIMIGTQIISKGLHFPNVTLVGVVNADTILNFPDFRAGEKTFQLVTQVAGRAGRGDKKGRVIVQTYQPENYTFNKIETNDYEGFYDEEISNRELLEYPPFSRTINIGISSKFEKELEKFVFEFFNDIFYENIEMFGPMRSLVYRVKDRFRYNIFIKGNRNEISKFKKILERKMEKYYSQQKFRITIDIDPINLI